MNFRVENDYLFNISLIITIEHFIFLTGKSIDFSKRVNKVIKVIRSKGHIRLYDEDFITQAFYKHSNAIFKCVSVSKDGSACMAPVENSLLRYSIAKDTTEWEIA